MKEESAVNQGIVATNRRATHDYFIEDRLETGLVLTGNEVKSVRARHVSLQEAYVEVREGELWVVGMRISPYQVGPGQPEVSPHRPRKLLASRRQIVQLQRQVRQKGYTLVPLRVYFTQRGLAKLEIGLGRGKRQYDKREALKAADEERRVQRALSER
ncbi:MAG: SsrA-binding protein SmpB [candidate division WS1 bacterium]|jgi:SsrA-binding protein|nr:SsrA-binding protein SmpB [candidate division WS1 bacterium]